MSRYWLTYCGRKGRPRGVLIVDSWSLPQARLWAGLEHLDKGLRYCAGYQLDAESAAVVPTNAIGRMLCPDEAAKIVRRIERPRRPAAASRR